VRSAGALLQTDRSGKRAVGRVAVHAIVAVSVQRAAADRVEPDGVAEHAGIVRQYSGAAAAGGQASYGVVRYAYLIGNEHDARPGADRSDAVFGAARHDAVTDRGFDDAARSTVADDAEGIAIDLAAVDRDLGGHARAGQDIDSTGNAAAVAIVAMMELLTNNCAFAVGSNLMPR
jgi:hypothetical protein